MNTQPTFQSSLHDLRKNQSRSSPHKPPTPSHAIADTKSQNAARVSLPLRFTCQRTKPNHSASHPFQDKILWVQPPISTKVENVMSSSATPQEIFAPRVGDPVSRPPRNTCQLDDGKFLHTIELRHGCNALAARVRRSQEARCPLISIPALLGKINDIGPARKEIAATTKKAAAKSGGVGTACPALLRAISKTPAAIGIPTVSDTCCIAE